MVGICVVLNCSGWSTYLFCKDLLLSERCMMNPSPPNSCFLQGGRIRGLASFLSLLDRALRPVRTSEMVDLPAPAPCMVLEQRLLLSGLVGDPFEVLLPPSAIWHLHVGHFGKKPETEL